MTVVVLFEDLLMKTMINEASDDIGVIIWLHFTPGRGELSCMLSQEFDMFLSIVPSFVHLLGALDSTFG